MGNQYSQQTSPSRSYSDSRINPYPYGQPQLQLPSSSSYKYPSSGPSTQRMSTTKQKLTCTLPIQSINEQQQMLEIVEKRLRLSQCPFLCTLHSYQFVIDNDFKGSFSCSNQKHLILTYDQYDWKCNQIAIKNYAQFFNQTELCKLIKCVTLALLYLKSNKLNHGDVSLQHIVKVGTSYRLLDKIFLKNNINAYQKVLQGQPSFISPKQMLRIRYGFIKQSPQLHQSDDIFSLGMCVLQLASQVPSSLCYKQMNVRFNQDILENNLDRVRNKFTADFVSLIQCMLEIQEDSRIGLQQILGFQCLKNIKLQGENFISKNENNNNFRSGMNGVLPYNKIKASDLNQTFVSAKSNTISLHRNPGVQSKVSKPHTPISQATKQSPISNSYINPSPYGMKSSQFGGQPAPPGSFPNPQKQGSFMGVGSNYQTAQEMYYADSRQTPTNSRQASMQNGNMKKGDTRNREAEGDSGSNSVKSFGPDNKLVHAKASFSNQPNIGMPISSAVNQHRQSLGYSQRLKTIN